MNKLTKEGKQVDLETEASLLATPSLRTLTPAFGSTKARTRVGRGHAAGKGKQAGRGQSGQKKRSKVRVGFEGGQNPWYRRIPKRGFNSQNPKRFEVISLEVLNKNFGESNPLVTHQSLKDKALLRKNFPPKILANGEILKPLTIEGIACSKEAKSKIEAAGGVVR